MKTVDIEYGEIAYAETEGGLEVAIHIWQDDWNENPREMHDNLGKMVCWHRRYNLGDEQPRYSPDDFWRELAIENDPTAAWRIEYWECHEGSRRRDAETRIQNIIDTAADGAVVLPLYLYDHSGITMNTSGFSCPWDSGQVGYIYATRQVILDEFGKKRLTKKLKEDAERILRDEVAAYDNFLTGNIHRYSVEVIRHFVACECCGKEGQETVYEDSCGGFYGDVDHVVDEVNQSLEKFGLEVKL